jgi:hypothetical protein
MSTVSLQFSSRTSAPRLAEPIGRGVARVLTALAAWRRPRRSEASQAAAELRSMAMRYESQPSFAADLRAAADRHERG